MSGDKFTDTAQATPRFVLPKERTTGLGCIPEGRTVSYQCIVNDQSGIGTSTTWHGNVFNCPGSSPLITLPHDEFQFGVKSKCGNLTAVSIGVNETEYTSRMTLTATTELNGRMINCTFAVCVCVCVCVSHGTNRRNLILCAYSVSIIYCTVVCVPVNLEMGTV